MKVCMMPSKHQQFTGFDHHVVCFNVALPSVVEMFVQQWLNWDSDIEANAEVTAAAWTYVSPMEAFQARRRRLVYEAPVGLHATQLFREHFVPFLSTCSIDPYVLETGRNVTVADWSEKLGVVY